MPRHRKGKKPVVVATPLYPGYIFVKLWDVNVWPQLRLCKDVLGVLCRDRSLLLAENRFVESLIDIEYKEQPLPPLSKGDIVSINEGPFEGFSGTYLGSGRVELNLFGRYVSTRAPRAILSRSEATNP